PRHRRQEPREPDRGDPFGGPHAAPPRRARGRRARPRGNAGGARRRPRADPRPRRRRRHDRRPRRDRRPAADGSRVSDRADEARRAPRGADASRSAAGARDAPAPPRTVTLLDGDGIGPEIAAATVRILENARVPLRWERVETGAAALARAGTPLPEEALASIRRNRVALKARIVTPL